MATDQGHPMGVTQAPAPRSARQTINDMLDAGLLDELMDRVDAGELALTGPGGAARIRATVRPRRPCRPRSARCRWTPHATGRAASSPGWSRRAPAAPAGWTR